MHELPITQNILAIALRYGQTANATKITDLYLVIGQLSSVVDESVQFYWPIISAGTIAEEAQLHFQRVPAELQCLDCNTTYPLDCGELTPCPQCDGMRVKVVAGKEFQLESIEIETSKGD
ncbi:MAG: hydrogenase maturation nickel metallochaperone HypA [Chloroflexi bacterium]|nr:hydrogenase maturation nickel metallochaperone HypA [Chloroflexota bacterium]